MNPATLRAALIAIFNKMNSMSEDGDAYCAYEMAKAIKDFILTGQVATTDSGSAPAGSYVGNGIGRMTIDSDALSDALLTTFEARYNNDSLADHMASDIDTACRESGIVNTTSNGIETTPSGSTSSFSGPGEGSFSGTRNTISNALRACFANMNNMTVGGNEYYASQFATAIFAYMQAGTINVRLMSPFVSGSGAGRIT